MKTIIKNTVKTALILLMSVGAITFSACSAEDGMDGAQGPQGEQGPAGQDGIDGEDGNANVIASDWFPVEFDEMSTATPPTWGRMILGNEDIPEVDLSEYMEGTGGVMLIYLKTLVTLSGGTDSGPLVLQLPFTYSTWEVDFNYYNVPGDPLYEEVIRISFNANDVSVFETSSNIVLRYILIPANTAAKMSNEKATTYEEAVALYGLTP